MTTPATILLALIFDRAWVFALLVPLVALLLLAHLLMARRVTVPVPSLIPWQGFQSSPGPGSRRRRSLPAWILRVLFLVAAVAAAAGPGWIGPRTPSGTLLVLFDRSASMKAPAPGGGTRAEAAQEALGDELGRLPGATRVLLRGFPPLPGGDLELRAHEAAAAARAMTPTDRPGSAFQVLREIRPPAGTPLGGVLIVSDGAGEAPALPAGTRARWVGGPESNLGIEAFVVEPMPEGRTRLFVRVRNASARPAQTALAVFHDARPLVPEQPLTLGPGEDRGVTLLPGGAVLPDEGILEVSLRTSDGFPADDRVFAAAGAAHGWSLVLAGEDAPFLSRFLRSLAGGALAEAPLGSVGPASEGDLFLFHRALPVAPPRRAPWVAVDALRLPENLKVRVLEGPVTLSPDAALAAACPGLADLSFSGVKVLDPEPALGEVWARAGGKPVVASWPRAGGRPCWFVGLPVDAEGSDWPLTPWFPVFWMLLVEKAAGPGTVGPGFGFRKAGQRISLPVDADRTGAVEGPEGAGPVSVAVAERLLSFVPDAVGIYRLHDRAGAPGRRVAVNLLDPSETKLDGRHGPEGALPVPAEGPKASTVRPLRGWAGAAAVFCLLLLAALAAPRRSRPAGAVLLALFALGPLACGKPSPPPPEKGTALAPGLPLPDPAPAPPRSAGTPCPACGKAQGEGHRCGRSTLCSSCGREGALEDHACGLSAFCAGCGLEAALVGHRCGETRFCPACKMDAPLGHAHEIPSGEWGEIK